MVASGTQSLHTRSISLVACFVPKKQEYVSVKAQEETPGMLSFKIMDFKEQLVLVYLDDRRNQKAAVGDYLHTYAAYKPASLVCMLVDTENGQRSKQVLFDTKHLLIGYL